MEFRVLGPFEVLDDAGQQLELGSPRARALLAFLVLRANEVVAVDRLVEELWSHGAPETAPKVVHVYVSQLRKALGDARDMLVTRAPGYLLALGEADLDLRRFEALLSRADGLSGTARRQALVDALALWRGDPLSDFTYESFAQPEISRLLELKLLALEARIDVDLELGGSAQLVPELESLVATQPLRERYTEQLMLALYRAGRQADALAAYRSAQRLLGEELGLAPGERLRQLERAILRQDPALAGSATTAAENSPPPVRSILVFAATADSGKGLLELAVPLAAVDPARELLLVRVVPPAQLSKASEALGALRDGLAGGGTAARVAAFSSDTPGEDVARLTARQPVDLVLLQPAGEPLADQVRILLERAPCDAGLVLSAPTAGPVLVPFGGSEHDWAALELGAWIARALERDLRLIGAADGETGADASRLLADASLILQLTAGVVAEPLLATPGHEGIASLAAAAGLLVVGLSDRWRSEGLGAVREELVARPVAPTVFVRRGIRPGGLAPEHTLTRFTWSIAQPAAPA